MAPQTSDYHPTDLDGRKARAEERQRQAVISEAEDREDVVWLLSGRRGRRMVRRQLQEAGISLGQIGSSFNTNYGQMCFNEGLRDRGFRWLSRIMQLLASGELPVEHFQKLMNEIDS